MKTEIQNTKETWLTERPGYSRWAENGHAYEAPTVDPMQFGPHDYDKPGMGGQGKCKCGCEMYSSSSFGPVDPFGACPQNPLSLADQIMLRVKVDRGQRTKDFASTAMNLLPEVKWDRYVGEFFSQTGISIFGWIPRDDGRSDFALLRVDGDGPKSLTTSSVKYSMEFSFRLFGRNVSHSTCKRVCDQFDSVKNKVVPSSGAPIAL